MLNSPCYRELSQPDQCCRAPARSRKIASAPSNTFVCIASSPPPNSLSRLPRCATRWPSGCRPTASPARSITGRQGRRQLPDVVHEFHHRHEPLVRRRSIWSSCPTSASATPTSSTTRTCPASMRSHRLAEERCPCGTEINIEQANLPTVIPVEMCYLGWQQSLAQLALLVEPDIPG